MPSPIVAEIDGRVNVLSGDHCSGRKAIPEDTANCFLDLEPPKISSVDWCCRWRPLPPPPFYVPGTDDYANYSHCLKFKQGVIGNKLYVVIGGRTYSFDASTETWDEGRE
ncbi:unnamed protein product [Linum trigynum]|uniref:Uncharacterized protein n=1 Tax=Linum trigynum TaxID=586398 RepID=A0AAV2DUM6_9ROSI